MKVRIAVACVGLTIALFAYIAKAVSGNSASSSSNPFAGMAFGGGSNPEAGSLQSPESAAQSAMLALHSQDWRKLYYVCAFEANEHKTSSDADDFQHEVGRAAMISHNPLTIFNLMAAATQFTASNPMVRGTSADVTTSWTIPYEGEKLSLRGVAHMTKVGGLWQLNLIQVRTALDDLLGDVTSRTGHGPSIVIPHFGPFGPHSFPTYNPPPQVHNPATFPTQPPTGGGGFTNPPAYQPGAQPGYRPPTYVPGPRFGPGQGTMPTPPFGPGQIPHGPQFGPGGFPHGPRFGPSAMPGGGMTPPQGAGGFNNSGGTFGSPIDSATAPQQPEGTGQTGGNSGGLPQ
jgi:hypothetical protein